MTEPTPHFSPAVEPQRDAHPPIRWWPAVLIACLTALAIFYLRFLRETSHQQRNLRTMVIGIVAVLLLLLWTVLLSRLRWKVRWALLAGVVGAMGLSAALFEIHGVTGDLVPILKFRWQRASELAAPQPSSQAPASLPMTGGSATVAPTSSFPQFMGPHRNATLPEGPKLARDWVSEPPQKLWWQPIGAAWSGFAVASLRAVTQEQRGGEESVVCYELLTGKVLWTHGDTVRYFTTLAGEGPRATPTIAGDKVVTQGATGLLNCLDLATGKVLWSHDIIAENQSHVGEWGFAGSPLVLGDLVIVNPGGKNGRSLVAYRLGAGEFVWGGGEDRASYSSPYATTLAGLPQVLMVNQHTVLGHDPASGRVLWQHPWSHGTPHVALPVVWTNDRVLISAGYDVGSELVQVTRGADGKFSGRRLWKTTRLKAKFNNVVTRDGFVYGLDLATGELKWKEGRYGHGQFILVRDTLLLTAENGEVVLLDPSPTGRRELTKFPALRGKTWNPPALAGDLLLVRNDQEAACYRLPVAK